MRALLSPSIRLRSFTRGLVLILMAFLGFGVTPAAQAQQISTPYLRNGPRVMLLFRSIVAKPGESAVRVLCEGKDVALGTVVAADGWILTKHSELNGSPVCKLKDGRELGASVISVDERFDLALLKIEGNGLTPAEWCDSSQCPVGNWVASVGTADEPASVGVVSVAARTILQPNRMPAGVPDPSSGFLGISMGPAGDDDARPRISRIDAGSAAEKVGLKTGDVILSVNGEPVLDTPSLQEAIQRFKPDNVITLRVQRGDTELELKPTLGKRPAETPSNRPSRSDYQNSLGSELSKRRTAFPTFLQHDSVIKPSDCGGPLVDLNGKVIGINIARAGRTESYAIPSEVIQSLLPKLMPEKVSSPRKID